MNLYMLTASDIQPDDTLLVETTSISGEPGEIMKVRVTRTRQVGEIVSVYTRLLGRIPVRYGADDVVAVER